jgi:phosphate-selective porin OprO/OprP
MVNTGTQLTRYKNPITGKSYQGTDYYQDFHLETAWVRGPFSLQAEGDIVPVSMNNGQTPIFGGGYIFVTYFLTGEHRTYDRNLALFDRIKPKINSGKGHPFGGAWELCARLNYITLDSSGVKGGTLLDPTFGFNWYMNPYTKLTFNYIPVYLNSPEKYGDANSPSVRSQANAWGLQAQVDF